MSNVDISSEAVERLAEDCTLAKKVMEDGDNRFKTGQGVFEDAAATLRAQAERIKELEGDSAAGLRREKDANERAMQHLRRAEKAEIESKNHAAFSHEWRERAERAEGQRCDVMTPQEAAKVLLDRWLLGEFENTADAAADDAMGRGGDSLCATEAWLRAISEDSQ